MYEKKDVSPVKATDLLVFGQISFFFVGLIATERRKIWALDLSKFKPLPKSFKNWYGSLLSAIKNINDTNNIN